MGAADLAICYGMLVWIEAKMVKDAFAD